VGGLKPAARKLDIDWVNWQVLRRSFATWLKMGGADVKDAHALMRQWPVPANTARCVLALVKQNNSSPNNGTLQPPCKHSALGGMLQSDISNQQRGTAWPAAAQYWP
jgi:hypothetical protein